MRSLALTGALGVVCVVGCAPPDRLAVANYDMIQQHVTTPTEVTELIGEPDNKLGDSWLYERPDKHLTVMIDFDKNGKVERKQWIDGLGESWHDSRDTAPREKR